jgi:hypothetical protein
MNSDRKCLACSGEMKPWCEAVVLNKHLATYSRCINCGLIITLPTWLDEAYSSAITKTDVGLVSRNQRLAPIIIALSRFLFGSGQIKNLDFGSGYGLLVRILRDNGVDSRGYDAHCVPVFNSEFHYTKIPDHRVDFVTAIEVLEHLQNPHDLFVLLESVTDTIVFSTELQPSGNPQPSNWWYYCLEHGQHISLYSKRALIAISEKYNARLFTYGGIHVITRNQSAGLLIKVLMRYKLAILFNFIFKPKVKSLTALDYKALRESLQNLQK